MDCPKNEEKCMNCHELYAQLRPLVKDTVVTKHFRKDAPGFDVNAIIDCDHTYFLRMHKFEETINGNHIFRALKGKLHIVYAIDKNYRLIFLRAFRNFDVYKKFLGDKKMVSRMIEKAEEHIKT